MVQLKELCSQHEATIFFDAVAGKLTGEVLENMPSHSTAYVYGALSSENPSVKIGELIFKLKKLTGYWLTD